MNVRRASRLASLVAGAAALSACATKGPDFATPAAPQGSAAAGYAMAGDRSPAGLRLEPDVRRAGPWWQAFNSPELDQVIRQALADSPSVHEAQATLERYQAEAAVARGAQQVQVDARGSAARQRFNTAAFGFSGFPSPTINLFSVGAAVSYDLDLFGGRRRATEAAEARAEQAARQADAAYLALSGNVALEAMNIAALQAEIDAVQDIVDNDWKLVRIVEKALEAGGQAPSARTGASAQLAEDAAMLPPLRRQLDASRHQLALLTGRSPASWTPPEFTLAKITPPADLPVALPSALVRSRPDILAAESELHVATARVGVAEAARYPDIRLSADLAQTSTEPEKLFGYSASGWSLLSGVTAPVLNGGALKAQQRAREAEARAAMARYQQTVLRAFVQVSDALADIGTEREQLAGLARVQALADTNLQEAQSAYRLGGGTLAEVVEAQRQYGRARRALVQSQGRLATSTVRLLTATAGQWRPDGG